VSVSRAIAAVLVVSIVAAVGLWMRSGAVDHVEAGVVVLVGDSLNVGTAPYLRDELPGWAVRNDSVVGRQTDEGLAALANLPGAEPVVGSLGTNDAHDAAAFADDVRRALRVAGPGRCLVWATIWRDGEPDDAFNDVLRDVATADRNLRLLEWAAMVAHDRTLLAPDGLHGSPEGYAARAAEAARLVRDCPTPTAVAG
jgi:hypothetical protein